MYLHLLCSLLLFSRSVVSNHLQPHGLQHSRLPCPPLSPGFCPNSCPLSQWCHPTISSSVALFSSCLLSFPTSGSFPVSWLSISGGQSIGASASASALVLPMNIQSWFPLGLTGLSPCYPKDSQEFSPVTQFKSISFSVLSLLYGPTLTSIQKYWKNHSLDNLDLCWQRSLLFNMLSRFVIAFLPRSKGFLIPWLQSPSAVVLESKKIKSATVSIFPIYLPWSDGTRCHDLGFFNVEF